MGLSRSVFDRDGDFSRKSQNPPLHFAPPLKGFPLELGIGAGVKKPEWCGYRAEKEVWRYLQPSGYSTPTWQTDGRTDGHQQQRPRLRIASRGKNKKGDAFLKHRCIPPTSVGTRRLATANKLRVSTRVTAILASGVVYSVSFPLI